MTRKRIGAFGGCFCEGSANDSRVWGLAGRHVRISRRWIARCFYTGAVDTESGIDELLEDMCGVISSGSGG